MGIFLDTVEDNRERGWDQEITRFIELKPEARPLEICPECNARFFDRQELQDHIFTEHRHERLLVSSSEGLRSAARESVSLDSTSLQNAVDEYMRLQNQLDKNQCIDLHKLNNLIQNNSDNIALYQYYKGICGYLEVTHFELQTEQLAPEVVRRLENVYGYLEPFSDPLAKKLRCAVAFKFNWFSSLAYAPKDSIFYLAHVFFTREYEEIDLIRLPIEKADRSSEGLYLSENMECLLELIEVFFGERINRDQFKQIYRKANSQTSESSNFATKLSLICARIHRKLDNLCEANQYYRRLRHNESFVNEVEAFSRYAGTKS